MIIRIAGVNIRLDTENEYIRRLCRKFRISDGAIDLDISLTRQEIEEEYRKTGDLYPAEICESICLFRRICTEMLSYDAFFCHSSVVEVDGWAFAFSGRSGIGKTTHTNLWMKHFGGHAQMINGDKPLYRYFNETLCACGHPWSGKEGLYGNVISPLKAFCFLEQGKQNEIRRLGEEEILSRIFQQLMFPEKKEDMEKLLELLGRFITTVPIYLLRCTISEEAVELAYKTMGGRK